MHHAQKVALGLLASTVVSVGSGCAGARPPERVVATPISLERGTVRIEGWFSARGEWMVNSQKAYQTYNPLGKDESDRCVSVINDTGAVRSDFAALDGKQVVVTGFAMSYEDLQPGSTFADSVMSKRYYKNEVVPNFCLRQWVFVAKTIQAR